MILPIDEWFWDEDNECVMARDMADKRSGWPAEVDFTEEHIGRLGAAAPHLLRAAVGVLKESKLKAPGTFHTQECLHSTEDCIPSCAALRAAIQRSGVHLS